MSSDSSHFEGWVCHDEKSVGNMTWESYQPKPWEETDVEIAIEVCGICASDLHTARNGWGGTNYKDGGQVVGHEIVGTATRVGSKVSHIKVGQRVGVGAQSGSCLKCHECTEGMEPWCSKGIIGTYNGTFRDESGKKIGKSYGGYAKYSRVPAHFAVPIPDGLDSADAAVMMCGGVTSYNPLKSNGCGQEGFKRVGVVGIGGLGHFALLFAKALGAEKITAISQTRSKEKLARELGATDFIATGEGDKVWASHRRSLDLLILCNNNGDMPLDKYITLVRPYGKIVGVGIPEEKMMPTPLPQLAFGGVFLGGSLIGGPGQIAEMLQLAADKKLKPMVEKRSMKDANQACLDMEAGKARFRYALVNEDYKASL